MPGRFRVLLAMLPLLVGCAGESRARPITRRADPWRLAGPFAGIAPSLAYPSPATDRSDEAARDSSPADASPASNRDEGGAAVEAGDSRDGRFWYLDVGLRTSFPRLAWAKRQLSRRLQLPLKVDVFGALDTTTTVLDRRRNFSLNTLHLGLGRQENRWFKWNVYAGGGAWEDASHSRALIASLSVEFDYSLAYAGLAANVYPFAVPRYARYANVAEHVKAGRPFLLTGIETAYVDAEGSGRYAFAPFTIYSDHESVRDWLFSGLVGLGWEVPLHEHWALALSAHYAFHLYRPDEFNGWSTDVGLRYRF